MKLRKNTEVLEEQVGRLFRDSGWRISVAESCTGGLVSHRITNIPGSSDYYDSGVISYSNQAKVELLKVPEEIIRRDGAVSRRTAIAMAEGIRRLRNTEMGLGVTGIAGPAGGTDVKPVGLVYIALSSPFRVECHEFRFTGDREEIKLKTSDSALEMILKHLEDNQTAIV